MAALKIRPDDCELDFLSLGALVHRLDPGTTPFRRARSFDVHVSGGEYNCAANLASCFGLKTGVATAMVNNGVGELIEAQVRERGVRPYYKRFEHDGVRGPNMATVYSDQGHGVRAPVVFYNRANEAGALLKPGDFDWQAIFDRGVRWFHSGGIFAAIGAHTAELIVEGMQAARAAGAVTSFDLNYRAKLWRTLEGGEAKGLEMMRAIAANVDVLVGNEEDLQKGLGLEGQDVEHKSKLDPEAFFGMIEQVKGAYPNVKAIATTLREVKSTNRHNWAAVLWMQGADVGAGERLVSPTMELDVLDRIGGGDGFASGLVYGLLSGRPTEEALRLGWAHGALLTTYAGDVSLATLSEVEALAVGGSARVQR
ncbi:sugar kinase [Botrimarina hoheduenensis]|uniref:2-dehydro-3-deoxygluconokinase n=1 Tax=Botrimarina hoheduenensis TaxID=2528000 RepID=A0A5C5VRG3_9BACT|nr:sugar kinase [Botrimarina hoheduenensis]TWT40229.1 2-dehydro-3-deoxygluconokinase [Botrimarina hoheduenensis]